MVWQQKYVQTWPCLHTVYRHSDIPLANAKQHFWRRRQEMAGKYKTILTCQTSHQRVVEQFQTHHHCSSSSRQTKKVSWSIKLHPSRRPTFEVLSAFSVLAKGWPWLISANLLKVGKLVCFSYISYDLCITSREFCGPLCTCTCNLSQDTACSPTNKIWFCGRSSSVFVKWVSQWIGGLQFKLLK